MIDIASS
jgi:hypothetical protein